mmetsp:Transcript_76171/g.218251  ORF Transcript_76171/g.218251 Transcript_76171/m.218251 type:complete len:245 (-) Transcript_76171:259-993(-)
MPAAERAAERLEGLLVVGGRQVQHRPGTPAEQFQAPVHPTGSGCKSSSAATAGVRASLTEVDDVGSIVCVRDEDIATPHQNIEAAGRRQHDRQYLGLQPVPAQRHLSQENEQREAEWRDLQVSTTISCWVAQLDFFQQRQKTSRRSRCPIPRECTQRSQRGICIATRGGATRAAQAQGLGRTGAGCRTGSVDARGAAYLFGIRLALQCRRTTSISIRRPAQSQLEALDGGDDREGLGQQLKQKD